MKKLNAKRIKTQVEYEFLGGTSEKLTVQSLSTKEFEEMNEGGAVTGNESNKKAIRLMLRLNDTELVEKILKELHEEGSVVDFTSALFEAINEEKKGKSNG